MSSISRKLDSNRWIWWSLDSSGMLRSVTSQKSEYLNKTAAETWYTAGENVFFLDGEVCGDRNSWTWYVKNYHLKLIPYVKIHYKREDPSKHYAHKVITPQHYYLYIYVSIMPSRLENAVIWACLNPRCLSGLSFFSDHRPGQTSAVLRHLKGNQQTTTRYFLSESTQGSYCVVSKTLLYITHRHAISFRYFLIKIPVRCQ